MMAKFDDVNLSNNQIGIPKLSVHLINKIPFQLKLFFNHSIYNFGENA